MKKVMYYVPLDKLYKVIASCQYTENSDFCPVLVKIVDKQILEHNQGLPYLLQVWTNRGQMVFERSLMQPISNWNISHDKFCFQEDRESNEIYVIQLFLDKQPQIFKFILPSDVTKGRINSYWSRDDQKFVIPPEQNQPNKFDDKKQQKEDVLQAEQSFDENTIDKKIVTARREGQ